MENDGFVPVGFNPGVHNANLDRERLRLVKSQSFKDCATIVVTPTRGMVAIDVVQSWLQLAPMMNQKFGRLFVSGAQVAVAYEQAIEQVLRDTTNWKYILTMEDDVIVPADVWPRLVASLEAGQYDGVSGLCWTRTYPGNPMIMGEAGSGTYYPQVPRTGAVQPCEAIPLGCSLFKVSMFRDPRWVRPWFRDDVGLNGEPGGRTTVDIYLCHQARKLGFTFAVDTSVMVGHHDRNSGETF